MRGKSADYYQTHNFCDLLGGAEDVAADAADLASRKHPGARRCDHGAEGVGRSATNAFVHSFVLILVLDLFLGIWLNNVHDFFRPEGPRRLL